MSGAKKVRHLWRRSLTSGCIAAIVGGLPSTLHTLASGGDLLEASRAVGLMFLPEDSPSALLIGVALPLHFVVSIAWATVLTLTIPSRLQILWGTLAGALIAILDFGIIGRLFPSVAALPFWPQFADHLLWGATVGFIIGQQSRRH